MPPTPPVFFLQNPVGRSFLITDGFNSPRNYTFAPTKLQKHEGVDIAAIDAQGRPVAVLAAQRGVVDKVDFAPNGYGNYVRIVHDWPDGTRWVTWYGHLSSANVTPGQFVLAGTKIGTAGTTGFSTGVHLHLTLQHIGLGLPNYTVDDVVDPAPFFRTDAPLFDDALFVADMTIPDGTVLKPGESFQKVWRVRNGGTTTWGPNYRLGFESDNQMGGPDQVPLPSSSVAPGQIVDVAVPLVAPVKAGRHRSIWRLLNGAGEPFGRDLSVEIEIKETKPFDEASYVADVTVEDGTIVQPGETFVKTWRVRNTGTTIWDETYSLRFVGNEQMGGPDRVPLTRKIKPGDVTELSVTLTAPTTPGRHRSTWKLFNGKGEVFEYEQYAEIQVPKVKPEAGKLNEMRFISDITIPDETQVRAGESFIKTWRVRNSGTTTWGEGYTLAFFRDEQMNGPDSVPLPKAKPGDVVDISIPLTAPSTPGMHKSTWKGRDPQGKFFEFDLYALIDVVAIQRQMVQLDELSWVADVTVEDGTRMNPGQSFIKTWRIRNTGTTTWGAGYSLAFFEGEQMGGPSSVDLPPVRPGAVADLSFSLTAPATPGVHKGVWKGRDPQGKFFDYDLFTLIEVADPNQTFDMLDFMRGDGRLYELEFTWDGGGRQRVQTQEDEKCFYHVKQSEWEELWADDNFIYRGTDTSPGRGEVYTLTELGRYGSAWLPRRMTVGAPFRRMPVVVFRRKADGIILRQGAHITWIRLEKVHDKLTLRSGIELRDVAELAAYEDVNGKPKDQPFERYFYARHYGLVAFEALAVGESFLVNEFAPGSQPDNRREVLPWLAEIRDF